MDLTSSHRSLFEKPSLSSLTQLYQFGLGVYHADKWRELSSYLRWEVKHKLGLFPKSGYLRFTNDRPLRLDADSGSPETLPVHIPVRLEKAALPWQLLITNSRSQQWGYLFGDEHSLYSSFDGGKTATCRYRFPNPIQSLFVSSAGYVFVCSHGDLMCSTDQGHSFATVLTLASTSSYFLPNNGMTELPDGRLVLGEYGVVRQQNAWQNLAYVYYSTDQGASWQRSDFLIRDGVNKHVHLVKYSVYLNSLFLTDGDNKKQVWQNRTLSQLDQPAHANGHGWHRLNQSHYQTGGYLSMAELNGNVFFGSDYLGGTNFIVSTTDGYRFAKQIVPDPYRRSPVMNMLTRRAEAGKTELWAVLHNSISSSTRSLLMFSTDEGKTWTRVIDYDGTQHEIKLVNASPKLVDNVYFAFISRQQNQFEQAVFCVSAV
ncbi:glycoside hydrolase [Spirosoma sp. RP8]|uniref:Glycoside hydrolase n=1 Tax=Spirosoma liriopis TaxID=2937440 RepID=A0ABT0HQH3_9BACT|nr:sialidase family protein [Spirosoma liriopis]MCK8494367.1 glycoside hydrolase [Spirosoma liriopis]